MAQWNKMFTKAALDVWVLTLALATLTSPLGLGLSVQTDLYSQVCINILNQTVDNRNDCVRIDEKFIFDKQASAYNSRVLLCCLDSFGQVPMRHNYNQAMDLTLLSFIFDTVESDKKTKEMACYVKVCHSCSTSDHKLSEDDYWEYSSNGYTCNQAPDNCSDCVW